MQNTLDTRLKVLFPSPPKKNTFECCGESDGQLTSSSDALCPTVPWIYQPQPLKIHRSNQHVEVRKKLSNLVAFRALVDPAGPIHSEVPSLGARLVYLHKMSSPIRESDLTLTDISDGTIDESSN
jgi:hypothetical protein